MPFKSKSQQRLFFAKEERGELPKGKALEWARETKNMKKLPEHVKKASAISNYVLVKVAYTLAERNQATVGALEKTRKVVDPSGLSDPLLGKKKATIQKTAAQGAYYKFAQEYTEQEKQDLLTSRGKQWEGQGRTMRNVGYGGMLGLGLGAGLLPMALPKYKNLLRYGLGGGALLSGLGGYLGEAGIRSGKGYQRAAAEARGEDVSPDEIAGLHYSPTAYNEAVNALRYSNT